MENHVAKGSGGGWGIYRDRSDEPVFENLKII